MRIDRNILTLGLLAIFLAVQAGLGQFNLVQAALGQSSPDSATTQTTTQPSDHSSDPSQTLSGFPVVTQFSPVPSGSGWKGQEGAIDEQTIHDTINNILAHGFTGLETPTHRPKAEEDAILNYARSRGMFITYMFGGLEGFGRDQPPAPCIYTPEYTEAMQNRVRDALAPLKNMPGLYSVFAFQDEPFHAGAETFGYDDAIKTEFKKRYGYDLPPDLDSIRNDPQRWLDVINFRADDFADAWRQTYKAIKTNDPNFKVMLTHDSHNTFGAGCRSNAKIYVDDVFHWGGDFADMFLFDIYPYMMFDFRFGDLGQLPKPRISQAHYTLAQMRNLTQTYGKELGFWVGTYNPAWFKEYIGPEREATYWSEREMSATAVAQGADYLLTGYNIPVDARHWESFGEGLRLIQKAGPKLMKMPKVKARACMLFPRTQLIQVQEEYFNVGLSYELFLRAFGELDILHEEQIKDDSLNGYQVVVLFDVTLLPADVAKRIAAFVENGGVVIADCVPNADAHRQPMATMEDLFGVKDAKTDRIRREGHWVPFVNAKPCWFGEHSDESKFTTDAMKGTVLGQSLDCSLVSPRPATVTSGEVLLKTASGQPALVQRNVGKGRMYLLGFCLQDTYFKTWQDENASARDQLASLLHAMTEAAGIHPHVFSSNPEIEASVRANAAEGFLFVINHEAATPDTTIRLGDLGFEIGEVIDLAAGQSISPSKKDGVVQMTVSLPIGQTRIFHLKQVSH